MTGAMGLEAVRINGREYTAMAIDKPSCEKCALNMFCPFPLHCESMIGEKVFIKKDNP